MPQIANGASQMFLAMGGAGKLESHECEILLYSIRVALNVQYTQRDPNAISLIGLWHLTALMRMTCVRPLAKQ